MKILKNILFFFLFINFTAVSQTAYTDYAYEENFNGKSAWPQGSNERRELKIYNGRYYFEHKKSESNWQVLTPKLKLDKTRDFEIETSIQKISGVQNTAISFIFDYKDDKNYREISITANGYYRISEAVDNNLKNIKTWTKSDKLKTGNYGVNNLKIVKKGNSINFHINGNNVYSASNKSFLGNQIGIAIYKNQKISLDYIRVKYLSSSKKNTSVNKTILFEGFTDNTNGWSTMNSNDASLEIKNGDYIFSHKRETSGWRSTIIKKIDASKDFRITTQIKKVSGINNNGFGLTFGGKDASNQNEFFISSDGSYMIRKTENGKPVNLKKWTKSEHIKKGHSAYNYLSIEKNGSATKFYINSKLVYTSYSCTYSGNRIGYVIYHKQKIAVGYLKLEYINSGTNPIITTKGDHIFSDDFNDNSNNWNIANNNELNFSFYGGKFNLDHKSDEGGRLTSINKYFDSTKDFEIESKFQPVSGVTNSPHGILWGKKDDNYFQFLLTANGYYKIRRVIGNKSEDILKWIKSSAINNGLGKSNTVKIRKEGDYYKFYINNVYVTKTDFESFYGSEIGFGVYFKQKVSIDYLKINRLKGSKTKPIITNKTLSLPLYDSFNNNNNNWNLDNLSDYSVAMNNGQLLMHRKKKGGILISKSINIDSNRDFIIETAIRAKNNDTNGMYGVTFGRKNSANEFSFLLSSTGTYKFRKFDNDKYKEIIPSTYSSAIKTGINQPNKLKIVKFGQLLRFYINDVYVNETPFQRFFGNSFGYILYYNKKIAADYLDIKYQTASYNNPPIVNVYEPDVSLKRGFKIVQAKKIFVRGKATDTDGIYEITINGIEASVSDDGSFSANVPLKYGKNDLIVKATDLKQATSTKTFVIKRKSSTQNPDPNPDPEDKLDIGFGKYYALIVGVSSYQDKTIPDLKGEPTKDAQALANVLTSKYSFAKENVTLLKNPTENQINREFTKLSRKIGKNDNLVIFYAGHGNYDKKSEKGYWMPSNTVMDFEENIILNTSIVTYIKAIKSKHTLLISDACFSGSILKTERSYKTASKAVQKKYALPSRKAITSGTLTTVPNESVFMKYLLKRLNQNTQKYLSAGQLFNMIEDPVINNTTGENQPQYAPIIRTGDEGGDFIFIKKN